MLALSVTIYVIFANQINFHQFDLENKSEGQDGEKRDMHHSTATVCNISGEFLQNFSNSATQVYAKGNHTHSEREARQLYKNMQWSWQAFALSRKKDKASVAMLTCVLVVQQMKPQRIATRDVDVTKHLCSGNNLVLFSDVVHQEQLKPKRMQILFCPSVTGYK